MSVTYKPVDVLPTPIATREKILKFIRGGQVFGATLTALCRKIQHVDWRIRDEIIQALIAERLIIQTELRSRTNKAVCYIATEYAATADTKPPGNGR